MSCVQVLTMGKLYPIEAFDQAVFKPLKEQKCLFQWVIRLFD